MVSIQKVCLVYGVLSAEKSPGGVARALSRIPDERPFVLTGATLDGHDVFFFGGQDLLNADNVLIG